MALLSNDELNNLYTEYFDIMDISKEQKLERVELAELLDDVFLFLFAYIDAEILLGTDIEQIYEIAERRYTEAIEDYGISLEKYPDIDEYARDMVKEIVDTHVKEDTKSDKPKAGNDDGNNTDKADAKTESRNQEKAIEVAENETNSIFNRMEYDDAVNSGYTTKTWVTEGDDKVRPSHVAVDMLTIPIDEPFQVGDSQLMFAHDTSLGASAKEIVNCRCTTVYS